MGQTGHRGMDAIIWNGKLQHPPQCSSCQYVLIISVQVHINH